VTFHYTDPDGHRIILSPHTHTQGKPLVAIEILDGIEVCIAHIPADRIEELIAGLRDTARQAAAPAAWRRTGGFDQHDDYRTDTP
jgi:hypothetical protein